MVDELSQVPTTLSSPVLRFQIASKICGPNLLACCGACIFLVLVILTINSIENLNATDIDILNMTVTNVSLYEDELSGIRIQYPANWSVANYSNQIVFSNQSDPRLYYLGIYSYPSSFVSLDEEVANSINFYKQNLTDFRLLDSELTTLENASAFKVLSTYHDDVDNVQRKDLEFLTIKGDRTYRILYSAEIGVYDQWLNTSSDIIKSLELTNNPSLTGSYDTPIPSDGSIEFTEPVDIAVNPQTNTIYKLNYYSDTLDTSTIDESEISSSEPIHILGPTSIATDIYESPLGGLVFVTSNLESRISVIDGSSNEIIRSIKVGNQPNNIAVNPITNTIYVSSSGDCNGSNSSNQTSSTICVIDYSTNSTGMIDDNENSSFRYILLDSIIVDKPVRELAVNPLTNTLYVSTYSSDTISVIDGSSNEIVRSIKVGNQPNNIAVNPLTNTLYVSTYSSDIISVIDGSSNEIIHKVKVDPLPVDMAVNSKANRVYVASSGDNSSISIIEGDTNEVIRKVSIARPVAVEIDPFDGVLYVRHDGYSDMSSLNTFNNRIVEDVRTKRDISFFVYPEAGGEIYCYGSDGQYDSAYNNQYEIVTFDNGTEVDCSAYPNRGFLFKQWEIDFSPLTNSTEYLSLKLTNQTSVGAEFSEVIPFNLLIIIVGIAAGCIALHFIHWRLILVREKKIVRKYIRNIEQIAEGSQQGREVALDQLTKIRIEISKLFKKGKIRQE